MKLLTVETESRLGTLWDQEQCTQLCSKDELWEAANCWKQRKRRKSKSRGRKRMRGRRYQKSSIKKRFWRRRLDRIGLDTVNKKLLSIEFKRTRDVRSNYVEKAIAVAQEQYTSLLTGLPAVGQVMLMSFICSCRNKK